MGESWFWVPGKSESFFFTQVCTRGHNSDSWGVWLWEDCDLAVSLKILQQWCHHLCRLWRTRKWNVWSTERFPWG